MKKRKKVENIVSFLLSALVSFVFLLNSSLHPWEGQWTTTDSSVFKTVSFMMSNGYMPYKDTFDHKGPLLYIINFFGDKIEFFKGVWMFEFIAITITFFFIFKIARIKSTKFPAILSSFLAISLLFDYLEYGNLVEEYAMPLISIALFLFLDYLINNKISSFRIFVSGFAFGAVLLLRPNMITVWIVFCFAILLIKVIYKDYKSIQQFILWFLIGALTIIIPITIWLSINGALYKFIEDYLIFNIQYTSLEGGRGSVKNLV